MQLDGDDPDPLCPVRHFQLHELLDGPTIEMGPGEGRTVTETVCHRDDLLEITALDHLFPTAVQIADDRFRLGDDLSVQLDPQIPQTVRHRVLRTHVYPHFCHLNPPPDIEVLPEREERIVHRQEKPLQTWVSYELDSEHIVGLALVPIRPSV